MYHQGDIIWVDLKPAKGSEMKKKRPCLIVSNDNYNHFFNTVIVLPISSSPKYHDDPKYQQSPFLEEIKGMNIHGTVLLQHVRAVNLKARSDGKVVDSVGLATLNSIVERLKKFL